MQVILGGAKLCESSGCLCQGRGEVEWMVLDGGISTSGISNRSYHPEGNSMGITT